MIKEDIIRRADEYLEKISESDLEKYQKTISKDQKVIIDYVLSMSDVFEDEDEYYNKYIYFFMLIHRSYTNRFRFFPQITKDIILRIEEKDQQLFAELSEKDDADFEKELESIIKSHPQKTLIDFITMDLFENDDEHYDDISIGLDNEMFFLLFTIINIYEESLVLSQSEVK